MALSFNTKEANYCLKKLETLTKQKEVEESEKAKKVESKRERDKQRHAKNWEARKRKRDSRSFKEAVRQRDKDSRLRLKSCKGETMILSPLQLPPTPNSKKDVMVGYMSLGVPVRHMAGLLFWLKSPEFTNWFFADKKGATKLSKSKVKNITRESDLPRAIDSPGARGTVARYIMFMNTKTQPMADFGDMVFKQGIPLLNSQNVCWLSNLKEDIFLALRDADKQFAADHDDYFFCPGVVGNVGGPCFQRIHLDHEEATNKGYGRHPAYVLHMPLCREGLALQLCLNATQGKGALSRQFLFVPFGKMLLLRSNVYHSGHFGSRGNLRLHAVIAKKGKKMFTFDRLVKVDKESHCEIPEDFPNAEEVLDHARENSTTDSDGFSRYLNHLFVDYKAVETKHLVENYEDTRLKKKK